MKSHSFNTRLSALILCFATLISATAAPQPARSPQAIFWPANPRPVMKTPAQPVAAPSGAPVASVVVPALNSQPSTLNSSAAFTPLTKAELIKSLQLLQDSAYRTRSILLLSTPVDDAAVREQTGRILALTTALELADLLAD